MIGTLPTDESVIVVQGPGLSYVCRRCQVYGYLAVGVLRLCWCCEASDRPARR